MGSHSALPSTPLAETLGRWAGLAGVLAGIALALAYAAYPGPAPPEAVSSRLWILVHIGFLVSWTAAVFLSFALLAKHLRHGGGLAGCVGCALSVAGLMLAFGADYAEVFILPNLAERSARLVLDYRALSGAAISLPAGSLLVAGFVVFATQLMLSGAIGRGAGLLTVIAALLFGIGLSGVAPTFVVRIGAVLFGAALVSLGIGLWRTVR